MKISELKQPYRRMAEYLAEENTNQHYNDKTILNRAFKWSFDWNDISRLFWKEVDKGNHPEITEEIKQHFPPDFDFSGEEGFKLEPTYISLKNWLLHHLAENERNNDYAIATDSVRALIDIYEENHRNSENTNNNKLYTQLAKEGRFDELPDTCEFSEAVNMEVWDIQKHGNYRYVLGKFNGKFVAINRGFTDDYSVWNYAQLPTPKIDFSEFKAGYVVEVETNDNSLFLGYFLEEKELNIDISYAKDKRVGLYPILKEFIKSITKIK